MDTDELAETQYELLNASYALSTLEKYNEMWKLFIEFILDLDLEISEATVAKYVAFLYQSNLKHSSIRVHLAAIARGLDARKLPDCTKSFIVERMLIGAKNMNPTRDIRRPFSEEHIRLMVESLQYIFFSQYERTLYRAVVTWAFAAGLRVSEYTKSKVVDHNLFRSSVDLITVDGQAAYRLTFRSYKSCPDEFPDFVLVQHPNPAICPVTAMYHYLPMRPPGEGPLFVRPGGANQPITRGDVERVIDRVCRLQGWTRPLYHSHSFRIGRATLWAEQGYSPTQIQHMGR